MTSTPSANGKARQHGQIIGSKAASSETHSVAKVDRTWFQLILVRLVISPPFVAPSELLVIAVAPPARQRIPNCVRPAAPRPVLQSGLLVEARFCASGSTLVRVGSRVVGGAIVHADPERFADAAADMQARGHIIFTVKATTALPALEHCQHYSNTPRVACSVQTIIGNRAQTGGGWQRQAHAGRDGRADTPMTKSQAQKKHAQIMS